ncbi:MAG TPA: outer membrane protein assembly factor BamC [Rhodocyclaceae bacterium]|nr:outer membrane protein assembly factor BamC [Rhodocyclaceae bacterium]
MKRNALLMASVVLALLAGCSGSVLESKKIEYKSAGKLPPLEIPPDLTQPTRDDRYAVPDVSPKGSATYSAYAGDRAGQARTTTAQDLLPQVEKMRIERSGTQRWLVVPGSPDKVWPGLKEFWQELGFIVNIELPEAGILETDWAENRAKLPQDIIRSTLGKVFDSLYSTAERDKFRTRLEKGAQPDTTEIYISHRGMYEIYTNEGKTETRWQPRPPDPELEAEMLRRLMVRLGMDEVRAKTLVADSTAKDERARMLPGKDGAGALEVREPFDRAWRRVGLALDRVGFTVEDRDRSQGLYFVRYVDPEIDASKKGEDKSFLSKLAFWQASKLDPSKSPQYRIHVKGSGETSSVQVLTREGGVDTSDTGNKILRLLLEQLK